MATMPASLRPLHVLSTTGADQSADLMASRDRRVQQRRAMEDETANVMDPYYAQQQYFNTFNRGQEDAAQGPGGFNRNWVPFFESLTRLAENNPDKTVKVDTASMTGIPMARVPPAPRPGLPAGYTEDRYGSELDAFAHNGRAPTFTASDYSGFPDVMDRFRKEMVSRLPDLDTLGEGGRRLASRIAPGSMRSLAKQGGY